MKNRIAVLTNTKVLFGALLKSGDVDCVCDIGSRDGDQALLFRQLRKRAAVLAFEANPLNFRAMCADARLAAEGIELFPFAISNAQSTAEFHITDVDYGDPHANKGTSSLLLGKNVIVKDTVKVETRRIDDFISQHLPQAKKIALWIDVEGAEFEVLEGMAGIKDRVVAIHVETAKIAMRQGQRTLDEVAALMASYGFALSGSNICRGTDWGDVVFVNRVSIRDLGVRFFVCKAKGWLGFWTRVDSAAVFLKTYWPAGYRFLRKAYLRVGT